MSGSPSPTIPQYLRRGPPRSTLSTLYTHIAATYITSPEYAYIRLTPDILVYTRAQPLSLDFSLLFLPRTYIYIYIARTHIYIYIWLEYAPSIRSSPLSFSLSRLSDYLIFRFPLSSSSLSFPLGHPYQPFTPVHYLTTQEFITVVSIPPSMFEFSHESSQTTKFQLLERAILLASFRVAQATNKRTC